ncbi:MAG: radical SAM family heme chaperone HemW [Lachnospira sp.]
MNNEKKLGIYIHIPFCVRKCTYCDFLSAPHSREVQNSYVEALLREIELTADEITSTRGIEKKGGNVVDSIFIGGGTPSVLEPELISKILGGVKKHFQVSEYAEVTIECNPGTLDEKKAYIYRESGINRISFGLQSVNDDRLKLLGRIHNFSKFENSYHIARQYGFNNINIDMMMSLPGQTVTEFEEELRTVIAFEPQHLSVYSLILEEGTYLYEHIDDFPALPTEDDDRLMYRNTIELLSKSGYDQYEISNFAKKGYECIHNIGYWERADYLGFGIGAASLFNGRRYSNTVDIGKYIEADRLEDIRTDEVTLTKNDCMEEYVFLGLRKTEGIDLEHFKSSFLVDFESVYGEVMEKNIRNGLLKKTGSRLTLTSRGVDISNSVMSDFILN